MAKKKKGYQSGRTVNPRAAGAAAMKRNAPKPKRRIRFEGPGWPFDRDDRPPTGKGGGWAAGGTVETDSYGKYTIARGSGAARPQKFRKNG